MKAFFTRQKRYGQILGLLTQHDMAWVLDKMNLSQFVPESFRGKPADGKYQSLSNAERIRTLFEELGPTFVKMGQIMATRRDLIPHDYIVEFKKLQDSAKPLPFEDIRPVVENAFDSTLEDIFESVDTEPLASASIGQVHRVVLKEGQEAVIKVQRPGIEQTIQMDLALMRNFAELARKTGVMNPINPVDIVREFERVILQELDFIVEGRKTDEFRQQHAADSQIVIPNVYWEYTRKQVLTLELIPGTKISDVEKIKSQGHDCRLVATQLVNIILQQVFIHGRFHSDPHPGNIMVMPDGRLALLDFGMHGHFDRYTRQALVDLLRDISERDHVRMADHLLKHNLVGYDTDMREMRQQIRNLMRSMEGGGQTTELAEQLMHFVADNKLTFPPDLFFLDKVFGTLDGAVKTLNPELHMRDLASSFLPELGKSVAADWKQYVQQFLIRLVETDDTLISLPIDFSRLMKRVDAGYLQMTHQHTLSKDGERQLSRLLLKAGGIGLGLLSLSAWVWVSHISGETSSLTPILLTIGLVSLGGSSLALLI